jgi:hypothetical protein
MEPTRGLALLLAAVISGMPGCATETNEATPPARDYPEGGCDPCKVDFRTTFVVGKLRPADSTVTVDRTAIFFQLSPGDSTCTPEQSRPAGAFATTYSDASGDFGTVVYSSAQADSAVCLDAVGRRDNRVIRLSAHPIRVKFADDSLPYHMELIKPAGAGEWEHPYP